MASKLRWAADQAAEIARDLPGVLVTLALIVAGLAMVCAGYIMAKDDSPWWWLMMAIGVACIRESKR